MAESVALGSITAMLATFAVLVGGAMTATICLLVILFVTITRLEFTILRGTTLAVVGVASVAVPVGVFAPRLPPTDLVAGGLAALMCGIFFVVDTKMIVGGTHDSEFSPEEYVAAAVCLCLDFLTMFFHTARTFGPG